jgi:predicted  nucleic acid-binding Zn-ribbon protein
VSNFYHEKAFKCTKCGRVQAFGITDGVIELRSGCLNCKEMTEFKLIVSDEDMKSKIRTLIEKYQSELHEENLQKDPYECEWEKGRSDGCITEIGYIIGDLEELLK